MSGFDEGDYTKVPDDFPRPVSHGAVPGTQPKFLATSYQGKFYSPGCSPPELYERWQTCEEIAHELAIKARESEVGKRSDMSGDAILKQYLLRLMETNWTSDVETQWIICRTAQILDWPIPLAARVCGKS
jgi:hypothetical protein